MTTVGGHLLALWRRARAWLLAPAEPSADAPWWDAGGHAWSLLFWIAMAVQSGALFRQKFLPFLDYPQHLLLGSILNRMTRPGSPELALYDTNIWSFNSLFHLLVAYLAFLLPIERAGEAALALIFGLLAVATLQLLRVTGRPRARAFLLVPLLSTFTVGWGLCNYLLSLAIQTLVLARVIEAPRVAPEGRLRFDVATAVLAVLGMWAHLLASMIGYALMLAALVADAVALDASVVRRLVRALRSGLPLLPALAYLKWSYAAQPDLSDVKFLDDVDDVYAFDKLRYFFRHLGGLRADKLDEHLAVWAAVALVVSALVRRGRVRAPPAAYWLMPTALVVYLMLPMQMWGGTWGVYPRVALVVGLGMLVFVPQSRRPQPVMSAVFCALGLAAAGSFFQLMGMARRDLDDFDRILVDAPPGRRVVGLMYNPYLDGYWAKVLVHFPAYYVARKGGQAAVGFFGVASLPVHYKPDAEHPDTSGALEFSPEDYDPGADYAKFFDLLIVHTDKPGEDPRPLIFGDALADAGPIRSHHGKWWLIEAKR